MKRDRREWGSEYTTRLAEVPALERVARISDMIAFTRDPNPARQHLARIKAEAILRHLTEVHALLAVLWVDRPDVRRHPAYLAAVEAMGGDTTRYEEAARMAEEVA